MELIGIKKIADRYALGSRRMDELIVLKIYPYVRYSACSVEKQEVAFLYICPGNATGCFVLFAGCPGK